MKKNKIQLCENCNPTCPPSQPVVPQPDPELLNPFSASFNPFEEVDVNSLFGEPEVLEYNKEVFDQLREDMFWRVAKDAYGERIVDAYGNPVLERDPDFLEPPPIEELFDSLVNKLPLTPSQRDELIAERNNIISDMGGAGSKNYSAESLYAGICWRLPSFQLIISINLFIPIFNLVASIIIAVYLHELFNENVAGVDVLVEISTQIVIELLGPLAALCFSLAALIPMPPIPQIRIGANISLNIFTLQQGINFSIFASLGLGSCYKLKTYNANVLLGSEDGGYGSATGIGKNPLCHNSIEANKKASSPLVQTHSFVSTSRAAAASEIIDTPYDNHTRLNLVRASYSRPSIITYSVDNMNVIPSNKKMLSGTRETLNRCKATEEAIIYLFNHLQLNYDTEITLTELLLQSSGFDKNTPLDVTILSLLALNIPQATVLNTGYVMMALGKTEPPCPVLMMR